MKVRIYNMFCFFCKIIFVHFNKEKDDMRSAFVQISFFMKLHVTFYAELGDRANHIGHVIFVHHSAMKTHLLTNQKARTIQIIL